MEKTVAQTKIEIKDDTLFLETKLLNKAEFTDDALNKAFCHSLLFGVLRYMREHICCPAHMVQDIQDLLNLALNEEAQSFKCEANA